MKADDDEFEARLARIRADRRAYDAMRSTPWPCRWWVVQRGYRQKFYDCSKPYSRTVLREVARQVLTVCGCPLDQSLWWGFSPAGRVVWRNYSTVRPALPAELEAYEVAS